MIVIALSVDWEIMSSKASNLRNAFNLSVLVRAGGNYTHGNVLRLCYYWPA